MDSSIVRIGADLATYDGVVLLRAAAMENPPLEVGLVKTGGSMRLKGVEVVRRRLRIPTRFLALGERPAAAGAEMGREMLFDGVWERGVSTRLETVFESLVEVMTFTANGAGFEGLGRSSTSLRFRLERDLRAEGSMFSESEISVVG
jgi:hypothetical protein